MELGQIKNITKRIEKEFIFLLIVAVVFSVVFYSIFFQPNLSEEEISEYSKSLEGDYEEYSNRINSAGVNIEDLIDSEQVKKMKYHGKLIEEREYDKKENPFIKKQ
ncbi:MAG: hypothetical protein U9N04_03585 [Patescibacteria group bacterium]|nr:hypothetical protein [Patescibacteria group bacterium]